jgi:hypothetical protein
MSIGCLGRLFCPVPRSRWEAFYSIRDRENPQPMWIDRGLIVSLPAVDLREHTLPHREPMQRFRIEGMRYLVTKHY